jgi:hypothetical protein
MEQERTVVIREYDSPTEAAIVEGLLKANGIQCFLSNVHNPYPMPLGNSQINNVKLFVLEKDKDAAEALIENPPSED